MHVNGIRTVVALCVGCAVTIPNGLAYAATYSMLYTFKGGSADGNGPYAALTDVRGALYGTTNYGGGRNCNGYGCGTVFKIVPGGAYALVYSFQGGSDGAVPFSSPAYFDGILYGTTSEGGGTSCNGSASNGCGTVFTITPSGKESVLYSFQGGTAGAWTDSSLISVGNALYGTTYSGGEPSPAPGNGTVFKITPGGAETVLYSFKGGSDGATPYGGLINVGGTLYGTTTYGGAYGKGTVFSIMLNGNEKILYSFKGGSDGQFPNAILTNVNGTIFGTTNEGGDQNCYGFTCGTVFKITPGGAYTLVYSFQGGRDGAFPSALLNINGNLYGTTGSGGGTGCGSRGCGTVFKIRRDGKEGTIYRFKGGSDGATPFAGLTNIHGALYGTTYYGGGTGCLNQSGCGTIFSITP